MGVIIYPLALYFSQFASTFEYFVLLYSILGGFGLGIVYFLPVLCGWSYFPTIRPIVAGSILSWFTLCGMGYAYYATLSLNPNNEKPTIFVTVGLSKMKFYEPDSP